MIEFCSLGGRIGPFWWVNADTSKTELLNAAYNGSRHLVWREGACGFDTPGQFYWRIIHG
jgi:hypothetical protein